MLTPAEAIIMILVYITMYAVLRAMSYKWRIERLQNNNRALRKELRK